MNYVGLWLYARRVFKAIARRTKLLAFRSAIPSIDKSVRCTRIGSSYGGWWIPEAIVRTPGLAICAGAGEDVSFDVHLNAKGFTVCIVDPTPRALRHLKELEDSIGKGSRVTTPLGFVYDLSNFDANKWFVVPVGLWSERGRKYFSAPVNSNHVSHSIVSRMGSGGGFTASVERVVDVLSRFPNEILSILKLDIEGAELVVLDDMLISYVRPVVLCVEFDYLAQNLNLSRLWISRRIIGRLRESGYSIVQVEGWNVTFLFQPRREFA